MKSSAEHLADSILEVSKDVRYVAIYQNGELLLRERAGLAHANNDLVTDGLATI